MNAFGPFGCILAFCASIFGGGPQSDRETPLAPQPVSLDQRYIGDWKQGDDSQCEISLQIEESAKGIVYHLKSGNTEHKGKAEPTENWIYLGDVASANYDASTGVLILRNEKGRGKQALPECNEDVIVLDSETDP